MIAPLTLFVIVMSYVLLLFVLAYYAEVREGKGRSLVNNPYVYSLSLAVYCTSWTFYGSVGRAAYSGLSFLPIYLGPTIMAALWPLILKRIVRISKANKITTIADFIGYRYGKSLGLSVLVTVVAVIGLTPYLGLQIKAIISTFIIITGKTQWASSAGIVITFMLGVFTIIFGARRLDLSERHSGIVFAIAFESLVKLGAFLAVGAFVTWHLFDGFADIFDRIRASGYSHRLELGAAGTTGYSEFLAITVLGMLGIMFLPRQFHMAVVENNDEAHIDRAAWLFPLYTFLLTIFVLPIAFGGLLLHGEAGFSPDYFVLTLPLEHGNRFLPLLVFLGGFSAATGMLIVEVLALSTMVMNSIVMPGIYKLHEIRGFSQIVLNTKRMVVFVVVFFGYLFAATVGGFEPLVALGLKSFEAVALFAPAFLFGLYWKRGNKYGAMAGLSAGFAVWFYTTIIPPLLKAGLLDVDGPVGLLVLSPLLNPEALFGVTGLGSSAHTLFWSMLVNVALYLGVSIFTTTPKEEELQALAFVESYEVPAGPGHAFSYDIDDIENILCRYMGRGDVDKTVASFLSRRKRNRDELTPADISDLRNVAEKKLAGSIGPSLASIVFEDRFVLTEAEKQDIAVSMERLTENLRLSRQELAHANKELKNRVEMEMLLVTISTRFISSSPQMMDDCIRSALHEVGTCAGFDRSYATLFSTAVTGVEKCYEWCADGFDPRIGSLQNFPAASLGWLMGRLGRLENVIVTSTAALPAEALPEREFLEGLGIRSSIMIPMVYEGSLFGILGFDSIMNDSQWREEEVSLLTMLATTFVNAVVRTRVQDELERSNRELQQFAYVASHDLQEPLRKVIAFGDRLKTACAGAFDEKGADYLARMQNAALRMRQLIEDLLAFSRVTSRGSAMEEVSLNEIVDSVLSDLEQAILESGARVKVDRLPPVKADKVQMGQLFQNLVSNAIKYRKADASPVIEITGGAVPGSGFVEIRVRDNGIGFDEKYLDRIFVPFQRLHTREEYSGTGIGLAICKKIVERHAGAISAKAQPGQGALFIVTLPAARAEERQHRSEGVDDEPRDRGGLAPVAPPLATQPRPKEKRK